MLKNSARISNPIDSLMLVLFERPKSVLMNPGPWKNCRLALPNWPSGPAANAFPRKKHPVWILLGSLGRQLGFDVRGFRITTLPTTLGTSVFELPVKD